MCLCEEASSLQDTLQLQKDQAAEGISCAPSLALIRRYIFFRSEENQALAGKTAVALLSPSAFTFAADLFAAYETGGEGLGWGAVWDDAFPLGAVMLMLCADTMLYFALAWYLAAVVPSQYGSSRPWHFCFKPDYWKQQLAVMKLL